MKKLKEKIKQKTYESTGITLIALVITIIVLLILADISIAMLTGQNGIINRAKDSKEQTEIAEEKETLKLAVLEAFTEDAKNSKSKTAKVTTETLKNVLDTEYTDKVENTTEEDNGVQTTFKESGRTYFVDTDGNVTESNNSGDSSGGITADEIAKNPKEYIGTEISNYTPPCTTTVNWQIFYVGNEFTTDNKNRIYLIASDYIERENVPASKKGTPVSAGNSSYTNSVDFFNAIKDYPNGMGEITDTTLKNLNSKFTYNSSEDNAKLVAYMLDTSVWNTKLKNKYTEYAIGGPSLELFFKSYDKKNGTDKSNKVRVIDENGYDSYNLDNYNLGNDGLYIIGEERIKAFGYLISSPMMEFYSVSSSPTGCTATSWNGGQVQSEPMDYISRDGFRPVICLNSNVKLKKISDTEYQIIEK